MEKSRIRKTGKKVLVSKQLFKQLKFSEYLGWIHAQVDLDELERGNLFLQLQLQARVEELRARNGIAPRVLSAGIRLRHLHQSFSPINWVHKVLVSVADPDPVIRCRWA
jgi:hypothetical protein